MELALLVEDKVMLQVKVARMNSYRALAVAEEQEMKLLLHAKYGIDLSEDWELDLDGSMIRRADSKPE